MQRKLLSVIFLLILIGLWSGCVSPIPVALLPTATAAPTQTFPSPSATLLPPPTVTLYPALSPLSTTLDDLTATEQSPNQTPENSESATIGAAASTPSEDRENNPSGMPPQSIPLGAKLFNADFSQGWPTINDTSVKIAISDGQYNFTIGPRDSGLISTSGVSAGDIYAQVDVSIKDCQEGGGYGLIFRQKDASNYYAFILFCNSTYSIIARVRGTLNTPIQAGSLPEGLLSQSGNHQLGVTADGDVISSYLDGYLITQVQDNHLDSGDVALYAFSQSDNILEVEFDNLEVWNIP